MIRKQGESVKLHARRVQAVCKLREKPPAVIIAPKDDPPSVATWYTALGIAMRGGRAMPLE
jgi:hypothetical protein